MLSTTCIRSAPCDVKLVPAVNLHSSKLNCNSTMITEDNSTGTYIIHYPIELTAFSADYTLFNNCNFNP